MISFIEINPKKAIEFGHYLSNTYRHYLKNNNEDFVLLYDELNFIKEYLEIYKAKFEDGFSFDIPVVSIKNQYILSLTIQELIDNIFKHNCLEKENPIQIFISIQNRYLQITNTVIKKMNAQSNQFGLESINKRYKFLTNKEIQINNDGLKFQVSIPILILDK